MWVSTSLFQLDKYSGYRLSVVFFIRDMVILVLRFWQWDFYFYIVFNFVYFISDEIFNSHLDYFQLYVSRVSLISSSSLHMIYIFLQVYGDPF